ncbi:MAG: hypothetical protein H7240_00785 [Glaciimonas sp.]|nr:hypothetical protein [Glaciimonas sp.]
MTMRVVTRKAGLSHFGRVSRSLRVIGKKPYYDAFPSDDMEALRKTEAERSRRISIMIEVAKNAAQKIADAMMPGLGNVVSRNTSLGATATQPISIGLALVMGLVTTKATSALFFLASDVYTDWPIPTY